MSRIFISHSHADNFEAIAFHDWLVASGWDHNDVFIDLHDLSPGERWKDALAKANERCEAIVFLASAASLGSTECRLELRMAEDYGKEIIVALLPLLKTDDPALGPYRDRQIVDLGEAPRDLVLTPTIKQQSQTVYFSRGTLEKIKARLDQLGIAPNAFVWRPKDLETASPYPGFESFAEGEAALFFGRAADIARGLAEVRKLRRLGTGQILLVQAASGAGKSSFLKAGLLPRLARDPEFVTLGLVRPATGILTGEYGLGRKLAAHLSGPRGGPTPASLHASLGGTVDIDEATDQLITLINEAVSTSHAITLAVRPEAPLPTPLLAVDQAEELFAAADAAESRRFLDMIARLLDPARAEKRPQGPRLLAPLILLWTIRADSLNALMHSADAIGRHALNPFLLPPISQNAYREIIEQPAAIANLAGMKVEIDPLLTSELVRASTGADALPLLAFTMRQLMADSRIGSVAKLTLPDYEASGGMDGVLKKRLAAAQRTAGASDAQMRQLMIPGLATWDNEASPPAAKRVVMAEPDLLTGPRAGLTPLVDALVEGRLLTRSGGEYGQSTLEVAHEALLRAPPIAGWLLEDREFLVWLANIARARKLEATNTEGLFFGGPMEDAKRWLAERQEDIPAEDRNFIASALTAEERRRSAERERQEKELASAREREALAQQVAEQQKRVAANARWGRTAASVGFVVALALASAAGWFGWDATVQKAEGERQRVAALASAKLARDEADRAEKSEAAARATTREFQITQSGLLEIAAREILPKHSETATLLALEAVSGPAAIADQRPYVRGAQLMLDQAYRAAEGSHKPVLRVEHGGTVNSAKFSPDGRLVVTASADKTTRVFEAATGKELARVEHGGTVNSAAFSPDGRLVVTRSADKMARVFEAATGKELARVEHGRRVTSAAFSPDGQLVVTRSDDKTARVFEAATGKELARVEHGDTVNSAAFSPDGRLVVTLSDDKTARVFEAATGRELARVEHGDTVNSAAFSPDGRLVLTRSDDKTARVIEAATGKELARVEHGRRVTSGAFSPDGQLVVTASADKTARVFEAATGKVLARVEHGGTVWNAAFSPDGRLVVTRSADKTARLFEAATGKDLARVEHGGTVNSAAFSPDGRLVVTASDDKTARVVEAATGKELARVEHGDTVNSAAFSPDGRLVVTLSDDKTARVFEAATGKELARVEHGGTVNSAAFSPDGRLVVTRSDDKTARVVEAATGKELARVEHGGKVNSAAFSPDGRLVVTRSDDTTARVFEAATDKELAPIEQDDEVNSAAFSPDGQLIVTASDDNTARVVEAATGKELARVEHGGTVWNAAFSPDGRLVVTASADKTARVVEAATGKDLARVEHGGTVNSAAFSPDGRLVVTASDDKTARVVEAATGKELARVEHGDTVNSAAFSPDGRLVVTASDDKTARVVEAATGKELARVEHVDTVNSAAFSPDGRLVVTASDDGTARVVEAAMGKDLAQVEHGGTVTSAAFSPDGRLVVTASSDATVRVSETATGKDLAQIEHVDTVNRATFSPDGRLIVSASADKTARMFEAATGKELARVQHSDTVFSAEFSPDGRLIVSASADKTVRFWRVWPTQQHLVDSAVTRAPQCLTPAQRKQYFLTPAPPLWCLERKLTPYHTAEWQAWLPMRQAWLAAGRPAGQEPPLPEAE